jgi:two-component system cell cycle response regulator DivK
MHQHHPHVVLLDMRLPGLDGWELASRIKADPDLCDTPIIAVSVQVTPADPKRALDAGCDEFVAKPFDIRHLKMLVKRYMER